MTKKRKIILFSFACILLYYLTGAMRESGKLDLNFYQSYQSFETQTTSVLLEDATAILPQELDISSSSTDAFSQLCQVQLAQKIQESTITQPLQLQVVFRRLTLTTPIWIPLYKQGILEFEVEARKPEDNCLREIRLSGEVYSLVYGFCSYRTFKTLITQGLARQIFRDLGLSSKSQE